MKVKELKEKLDEIIEQRKENYDVCCWNFRDDSEIEEVTVEDYMGSVWL